MGDECTKFFHANATIWNRINTIGYLSDTNGNQLSDHEAKAALLWNSFKDRMGRSDYTHMYFQLQDLLSQDDNLGWLEEPFTKEEIDKVISELPNDKSPAPDGFNEEFLKKCWHLIAPDFYKLVDEFYRGDLCLKSINSSYIALLAKTEHPIMAGDFRPISLLNSALKLLTKLLVERLQKVIKRLIHKKPIWFHQDENHTRLLGMGL